MRWTRAITTLGSLLAVVSALGCEEVLPPPPSITVTVVTPATGPLAGGTRVTITGTNFTDVTAVSIGGRALGDRTMVSTTEITGTTPAASVAGAADVLVASSGGGSSGRCSGCFSYEPINAFAQPLATGFLHSCGLTSSGAAYCWGWNGIGQLGNGSTTTYSSIPVAVAGGFSFSALAAGFYHSCGLTSSGAAYCWGTNNYGELGDGSTTSSRTPVAVAGSLTFSTVAAGYRHTCGLTSAGAAYCWGDNSLTPHEVSGGLSFRALATSWSHTCGLTRVGVAYCWGDNSSGQLGNGSTTGSAAPVPVSGGLSFSALAAGGVVLSTPGLIPNVSELGYTCGLTSPGAAYCWGDNSFGQLGDDSTTNSSTPVAAAGGLSFRTLTAGYVHSCGLTNAGAAYCWGENSNGQLGDGWTTSSSVPVAVSGGLSFDAVAAGAGHTCGLTSSGAAYCWGNNSEGQLGDGTTTSSSIPVAVAPFIGGALASTGAQER